jgi:hypothetical protein
MYGLLECGDMTAGGGQIQCVSPQMVPPRQLGRGLQRGNLLRNIDKKLVRRKGIKTVWHTQFIKETKWSEIAVFIDIFSPKIIF